MTNNKKAIRSSGWQTDFLIGFPEGLLLLFFTTRLAAGLNISVQDFYTLNAGIWLTGALLVMITAYQANKGDGQHDESTLSPEERRKLQRLDISEGMIKHIEAEMAKDAELWESTLQAEQVQLQQYRPARALRSAFVTGAFFLLGGLLPFWPYLLNENFESAGRNSLILTFSLAALFAYLKARMTSQPALAVMLRMLLYAAAVLLGAFIVTIIFA